MVVDQLLADLLVHASQGVVGSGEVTGQLGEGALQQALNTQPLLLGDARRQTKAFNAASNSNTDRFDRNVIVNVALNLGCIHIAGVHCVSRYSMVFLDDRIEDFSEISVAVLVPCIDTSVLIIKLHSTGNCFFKCEPRSGSLVVFEFCPQSWIHMLCNE